MPEETIEAIEEVATVQAPEIVELEADPVPEFDPETEEAVAYLVVDTSSDGSRITRKTCYRIDVKPETVTDPIADRIAELKAKVLDGTATAEDREDIRLLTA